MNDMPDAITGGALIAGGVLIGLLFRWLVGEAYCQMRRIRRGLQVTAQVVGVVEHEGEEDPVYGGGGRGFAPVVSFRSADGDQVTASGQFVFAGNHHRVPAVGATMKVHYDPHDPRQIYIRGWDAASRPLSLFFLVLLAIGPLIVLMGAYMLVIAFVTG
jgi:hypothetical protein